MSDYNSPPSDHSGFLSGLALGLVLGAAGSYYLENTEQGKKMLANLKDQAKDAVESIKDNPALAEKIADLQSTIDQASSTVNSAAERVADATSVETTSKKTFFQRHGLSLKK